MKQEDSNCPSLWRCTSIIIGTSYYLDKANPPVDGADNVGTDQSVSPKATAVNHANGDRWAIDLLIRQINVNALDWHAKVGVLRVVCDHGRLNRIPATLNVDPES